LTVEKDSMDIQDIELTAIIEFPILNKFLGFFSRRSRQERVRCLFYVCGTSDIIVLHSEAKMTTCKLCLEFNMRQSSIRLKKGGK